MLMYKILYITTFVYVFMRNVCMYLMKHDLRNYFAFHLNLKKMYFVIILHKVYNNSLCKLRNDSLTSTLLFSYLSYEFFCPFVRFLKKSLCS
jgi:hypothetical protein